MRRLPTMPVLTHGAQWVAAVFPNSGLRERNENVHHRRPMPVSSNLTLADCFAARHRVTVWCTKRHCPGRDLDLAKLGRWADRGLIELAEKGKFRCKACGSPAGYISVSGHLVSEPVLTWKRKA